MATIKRIRRRKINIHSLIILFAAMTFMVFLYSTTFVKMNNVNLNIQIQDLETKIAQTKVVNDSLALDIQELASYESIAEVAKEAGLTNQQNNIISLREKP